MTVRFVTGNEGKVEEAREYLAGVGEDVEQVEYDYTEVQSDDLAEIATRGARDAFAELGGDEPVLVDDTGLFVEALGGFPGPYAAYVQDTLAVETIPELVADADDRRAAFRTVVAYCGPGEDGPTVETFEGAVRGTIVEPRGEGGFGYDPVFEHGDATLAEMDTRQKNAISHRGRALAKFADWLAGEPAERKGPR
ncbi:MAG: RdgB/HAM1 family non-canonical purine NTP pyrophosphatase [Halobacteriales archaeon]